MTNELLAEYIQQGGNDELIPILWEKVRKLLYSKSDSLYRLHKESCSRRGVEMWDIRQASYTAFLDAIKAYKPETGNKFTSYLNYPFKNVNCQPQIGQKLFSRKISFKLNGREITERAVDAKIIEPMNIISEFKF